MKELPFLEQFRHLKQFLLVAGIKKDTKEIIRILITIAAVLDVILLIFFIVNILTFQLSFVYMVIIAFLTLSLGFLVIFVIVWLFFLIMIDYLKFKRRMELEEILPEFLRLISANHRSGLTLDMSIWKANRPRFGVLSDEINEIAKKTYATGDLVRPLKEFGAKYDSVLLKRVISNIVEGILTGADISGLLDEIAVNIATIQNTRKELASEVENYMLFITLTVLIIAPLMFALTQKLSGLIEDVRNTLADSMGQEGLPDVPISIGNTDQEHNFNYYFDRFVILMITTNSIVSVLLMSIVKYGNFKQDLKKIPVYFIISLSVYLICKSLFAQILIF